MLRIADHDLTWVGLNWLRPAKHQRIGSCYVLLSSILLGLPGVAAGAGLLYLILGRVQPGEWVALFGIACLAELTLHILFAHYWNKRAENLAQDVLTAA